MFGKIFNLCKLHVKKAEHQRIDDFELWCWRRLLRVPWTARRSNQSILKEISPGCSLEGLLLRLKLQYFGHLMQRVDSLEKILMLGGIGGRRRRGRQRMRWLDGITDSHMRPGVLQFMGSQRVEHDWATELNWTEPSCTQFCRHSSLSLLMWVCMKPCMVSLWGDVCAVLYSVVSDSLWPHGSSLHGISQARILKWVAISFSRGSCCIMEPYLLHWQVDYYYYFFFFGRWILYHREAHVVILSWNIK